MTPPSPSPSAPALCPVGSLRIGQAQPLCIIGGPCVIESLDLGLRVGEALAQACRAAGVNYIFKASFDKANRSSIRSARGPGLERGLEWIRTVASRLGVPCTTDLHDPAQAEPVAHAVDLLQIPAFLCRQTDLLLAAGQAAARHQRAVNVKKGQFMSPHEMKGALTKLREAGCERALLTERGTFFGYGRLVNDFLGVADLMDLGAPVCFDCTHSTQAPGLGAHDTTGGRPDRAPHLARAAVAVGVHAVFMEAHPDPKRALSDAATQLDLPAATALIASLARVHASIR